MSVLLCRDSRHFYSAVSASEDFFDFALYKCSHYITLHYMYLLYLLYCNCSFVLVFKYLCSAFVANKRSQNALSSPLWCLGDTSWTRQGEHPDPSSSADFGGTESVTFC